MLNVPSSSQPPPRPSRNPRWPSTQDGRVQTGYFTDTDVQQPVHTAIPQVPSPATQSERSGSAIRTRKSSPSSSFINSPRLSLRLSTSSLSSSFTSPPRIPVSNHHIKLHSSSHRGRDRRSRGQSFQLIDDAEAVARILRLPWMK